MHCDKAASMRGGPSPITRLGRENTERKEEKKKEREKRGKRKGKKGKERERRREQAHKVKRKYYYCCEDYPRPHSVALQFLLAV